jgi:hypothetical protein
MGKDKQYPDGYPASSENDKKWKHQDEFDSAGTQRQQEDEDINNSIAESADTRVDKTGKEDTYSVKEDENSPKDREQ